jgi:hypothetical protein
MLYYKITLHSLQPIVLCVDNPTESLRIADSSGG